MRVLSICVIFFLQSCLEKPQQQIDDPDLPLRQVDVILGQSNANGHENVIRLTGENANLKERLIIGNDTGFIRNYWAGDSFHIIKAGENTSQEPVRFGIQPRLASNLIHHFKENVYLLQSARNGYPIRHWHDGEPLMEYLIRAWDELKEEGRKKGFRVKIRSVIFIHGEADAAIYSSTYKKELQELIARVRSRTNQPDLLFIIVQALSNSQCAKGVEVLQQKQLEVSQELNNALVPYTAEDSLFDGCHYNIATYNRKADAIFELIRDRK